MKLASRSQAPAWERIFCLYPGGILPLKKFVHLREISGELFRFVSIFGWEIIMREEHV
jgi:hypothetical protein